MKESAAATVQAKSQEPKPEQPVAAAEKKPAEPAQPAGNTTAVVEEKKTEPEKVQPEAKPEAKAAEPQAQQPAAPKPAEPEPVKEESKIFTLKSEKKLAPKVNVLGKIDLDLLNQSTRPKKKTKEERRKEREEKAMQAHPDGKKKRSRITKERVNIDQAVKQTTTAVATATQTRATPRRRTASATTSRLRLTRKTLHVR